MKLIKVIGMLYLFQKELTHHRDLELAWKKYLIKHQKISGQKK